ncbi:MAG TPA: hypothetical protein VE954_21155 [Oligoflexus sp.]|uniref:hypothetical protein n=1 Tax=Oligoflexus sp. TaxID=1971216 RepID=UPI002D48DEDE|nr:hypothetical protein [Oligoflexus sp.]HYX35613.1 hypothetical protein [Oligoflexus sp.]
MINSKQAIARIDSGTTEQRAMDQQEKPTRNYSFRADIEDIAGPVPDKLYFIKLFKRHYRFWLLGSALIFAVALSVSIFVQNVYTANIHAIFDQTDMAGTGVSINPQVSYNTVARLFRARFRSQEFLAELVQKMGGGEALFPPGKFNFIDEGVQAAKDKVKALVLNVKPKKADPDASPDARFSRNLTKMLDVYPEPESGILTLTVYSQSPEISTELASQAMELFITRELEDQIKNLELKLEFYRNDTVPIASSNKESVDKNGDKKASAADSQPNRLNMMKINEKESEILDKIRLANDEVSRIKAERSSANNTLGSEIAKLLTNLQPNHPMLISKKRELDSKMNVLNAAGDAAQKELEQWKQALWSIRATKTGPTRETVDTAATSVGYQGAFYVALNDRIKDLDLEIKNLQRQKSDPNLRTRLRILFPASFDAVPFANKKRDLFIAIFVLGLAFVFGFTLVQEIRCPLARDDWRIQRASGQPIITQISKTNLEAGEQVSAQTADSLREKLFKDSAQDTRAKNFLSYRRWELAVEKHCKGSVLLLLGSGSTDEIGSVIYNFFNIFTTDTGKKCLLVDLDHKDPVVAGQPKPKTGFVEAVLGQSSIQDAICLGKQFGLGFDFIPPPAELSGERTRIFRKKSLQAFFANAGQGYDLVFVRGLPEYHFIENTCLLEAADDCILCVDASRTQFAELRRTVMHMDSEKLRGLVVIGS